MATKKTVKKIDTKKVAKIETVQAVQEFYENQGIKVSNGVEYGFTDTTLVLHLEKCDIQVKIVAPSNKNGDRYTALETENE